MSRLMSFSLTTDAVLERRKTVTRRLGWWFLKPGDELIAIRKAMGLKKGEKVERLCRIHVLSTRREPLFYVTVEDVRREGFPDMSSDEFIARFCGAMRCGPETEVNRIEFEYTEKLCS